MYSKPFNVKHPMMEEKKDPMSDGMAHCKEDFRIRTALDHHGYYENEESSDLKPVFAYSGTDKGVAK